MAFVWPQALKRFFRSPTTLVGELVMTTLLECLGAALSQASVAADEAARLGRHGAFISFLVDRLALNHMFTIPPFLAFAAGAVFRLTSLSQVSVESPGYGGRTATLGPVMHL